MTTTTDATAARASDELIPRTAARPEIMPERSSALDRSLVAIFVTIPFVALIAAVPLAWGWGLGWHDIVLALAFYYISGLGVSVGLHRYFTHGSFKATRGSLA